MIWQGLLGTFPREAKPHVHSKTCPALFLTVKGGSNPCAHGWTNRYTSVDRLYGSAIHRKEVVTQATQWVTLKP